ncbi:hypothetical protein K2173_007407 [Erythroxylum novogranatense]|uniref:Uncharacterized protein n=1 Tax=Erythroxylum novogranatense TaxID=1862640 RepID=A0AAV8T636_9ROSI|nr:hypothetical protein K2173_007407 [Erythroxylum novogranatense]
MEQQQGNKEQASIRRNEELESEAESREGGLPLETSPYLQYTDLEDYKSNAYGTQGHLQVKRDQGGGATEGPTLSGDAAKTVSGDTA